MTKKKPQTLGELKQVTSRLPGVREEMRTNLLKKIEKRVPLFSDLIGYDDTVSQQILDNILGIHCVVPSKSYS